MPRSIIKSIQRASITIAGAATTGTATITAVVTAHTQLRYLGDTADTNNLTAAKGNAIIDLTNTTTVTATRNTADAATMTISIEVVEYVPGIIGSVQRGTFLDNASATITAVVMARATVDWLGFTSTNTTGSNNQTTINSGVKLTNTTTVDIVSGAAGGAQQTVGYQVIEWR